MKMKRFLVVVDAQNDFMQPYGALSIKGADLVIDKINDFLYSTSKDSYVGALFTFDTHHMPEYVDSEEGKMFPPHCIEDTKGWGLAVSTLMLNYRIPQYTLKKGVFDMWAEEDLYLENQYGAKIHRDGFFGNLLYEKEVTEVDVIGVALNFCVKYAVDGLIARGFKVNLYANCTKGIDTGNGVLDTDPALVFKSYIESGQLTVVV